MIDGMITGMAKVMMIISGILAGAAMALIIVNYGPAIEYKLTNPLVEINETPSEKYQVVGFLPYWLLTQEKPESIKSLTTLTYFGLTAGADGEIVKFNKPGESEPGWHALNSGKLDQFLEQAKQLNIKSSLLIFTGNNQEIYQLLSDPVNHADNLSREVIPILKKYGFEDLNLDMEFTGPATAGARINFLTFLSTLKQNLRQNQIMSLTVETTASETVNQKLIDVGQAGKIADQIIMMAYDFHAQGSPVTGPVSPISGGKVILEFDISLAVDETLKELPADKLLLGIPLYGYEWESLTAASGSAVIPGTGVTASSKRVGQLLENCPDCQTGYDETADEAFVIFKDLHTGSIHHIFYPNQRAMAAKINLAKKRNLGGLALWALGYESPHLLDALDVYPAGKIRKN